MQGSMLSESPITSILNDIFTQPVQDTSCWSNLQMSEEREKNHEKNIWLQKNVLFYKKEDSHSAFKIITFILYAEVSIKITQMIFEWSIIF